MKLAYTCLACGKALQGRSDKKYCDYYCRNLYHNRKNSFEYTYYRRVNQILRKNYDILSSMVKSSVMKVEPATLEQEGFNFQFFTSTSRVQGGKTCYFCYDLGYLPSENGYFALRSLHERTFSSN